jgi:hypothetical protein
MDNLYIRGVKRDKLLLSLIANGLSNIFGDEKGVIQEIKGGGYRPRLQPLAELSKENEMQIIK